MISFKVFTPGGCRHFNPAVIAQYMLKSLPFSDSPSEQIWQSLQGHLPFYFVAKSFRFKIVLLSFIHLIDWPWHQIIFVLLKKKKIHPQSMNMLPSEDNQKSVVVTSGNVFKGGVPKRFWAYGTITGRSCRLARVSLWGEQHLVACFISSSYYLCS